MVILKDLHAVYDSLWGDYVYLSCLNNCLLVGRCQKLLSTGSCQWYINVCTCMPMYIQGHACTYKDMHVHTCQCMSLYILDLHPVAPTVVWMGGNNSVFSDSIEMEDSLSTTGFAFVLPAAPGRHWEPQAVTVDSSFSSCTCLSLDHLDGPLTCKSVDPAQFPDTDVPPA
jgi:hypothetical protein